MWLTSVSIRRPVFILMVVSALIVLGLNALSKMRLELNPKVDFPFVSVLTIYPGAGPAEIETQVTKKIEDAVASVNGVKTVTSSSQEGQSVVNIEFYLGTSTDVAGSDVREKIGAIRNLLPVGAKEPVTQKFDVNSQPIIYYGMTGRRPSRDLRDLADNVIKPRLSKVPDVAAINITGGDVREISVGVYRDRLEAYGLGINQLVSLLQSNTLNFPAGHVVEGNREYSIRVVGEFPDIETIRQTRLHVPNGQTVKVSDIADVQDAIAERRDLSRINREDSIAIVVQKTSEGNTVDVAKGVRAEVALLEKELPKDIKFNLNQDLSENTVDQVNDVKASLFLGTFLAVFVVYLFLHNLRGTAIVAIAIPTSIIATFLVMFALGFTLNGMTLLALSLSVGILVDDSIVVLENIYRHLMKGEQPVEAAINGRSEIGLAAITITLVDVVVFLPIAFMGGVVGQFFKSYGITVAVATLFSLFMSFTLTPMLASRWYKAGDNVEAHGGVFGAFNRFYGWLDSLYRRLLAVALKYRGIVLYVGSGILVLVFVAIIASFMPAIPVAGATKMAIFFLIAGLILTWRYKVLGVIVSVGGAVAVFLAFAIGVGAGKPLLLFRFAPDQDQNQVSIVGEMAAGTSLEKTLTVAKHVEDIIHEVPDVDGIFTSVGATAGGRGFASVGPHYFTISVKLKHKVSLGDSVNPFAKTEGLRRRKDSDVANDIRKRVGSIPGAMIKIAAVTGFGNGAAPLQVDIMGQDINQLTKLSEKVLTMFKEEPGTLNQDVSVRIGKPEMQITVDREKAADYGLSVVQIGQSLRTSLEGDNQSIVFREHGNEYPVNVHFVEMERHDVNRVKDIVVGNIPGPGGTVQPVKLNDVAKVEEAQGPTKIDRMNRQKLVSVTANVAPGFAPGNMQLNMKQKLDALQWGSATYAWGGENKTQQEEGVFMMAALGLAIILVYMLMAALFDNLLYPLVIMLSLPQAMVGALLGLMIAGQALTIIAMIGIIMLVGLVTKNAILLVDYTNTLRERGLSRTDALLEAGPTRLRPILMTTVAMVFGMLPTALSLGRGGEFRAPVATSIVGGLILSTMLTLLVIPCVYTYFDDLSRFVGRVIFRRRLEPEKPSSPAPKEPVEVGQGVAEWQSGRVAE